MLATPTPTGPSIRVTVLLFAGLRRLVGRDEVAVELPIGATAADAARAAGVPEDLPFVLAVDEAYATEATPVYDGQTVACVPPVSGGTR